MITRIDHVGIVVKNTEEVLSAFSNLFGFKIFEKLETPEFKSTLISKEDVTIELIEPISSEGTVAKFLERGGGLHHISLRVDDIDKEIKALKAKGARLLSEEPIEATKEARVMFVHPNSTKGTLIELIHRAKS